MENEPEKYNVLYCKGKYQYKSKYPQIETDKKRYETGSGFETGLPG